MTFTVIYRDKMGIKREEKIDAADRTACVAEFRARGNTPLSVREERASARLVGRNSPVVPKGLVERRFHRNLPIVMSIAIVIVAIAGGVWWLLRPDEIITPRGETNRTRAMPKEGTPVRLPQSRKHIVVVETNEHPKQVRKRVYPDYVTKPRDQLTRTEKILLSCFLATNQLERAYVQDRRLDDERHPPLFTNTVHTVLGFFAEPSDMVLPTGYISDAMARQAFATPIEVTKGDTEEQAGKKMIVKAMLQELREYMAGGGHANEYFQKLEERQTTEALLINESKRLIDELITDGHVEEARETQRRFDAYLKEKGLPPAKSLKLLRIEHEEWINNKRKDDLK